MNNVERRQSACPAPQCKTQGLQEALDRIIVIIEKNQEKADRSHDAILLVGVEVKHLNSKSQDQHNRDTAIFSRLNGLEHSDHHQHIYNCINNCVSKKGLSLYLAGLTAVFAIISFVIKVI